MYNFLMRDIRNLEHILKALANRKRLQIVQHLKKKGSSSVGEIAKTIHLSVHGTSKHMQILRTAGIVTDRKRGIYVAYRLSLKKEELVKKVIGLL